MTQRILAVCLLAMLLVSCDMPQIDDPNSLRARVLGTVAATTPQAAQVVPTSEPTTPPQPEATAQPMPLAIAPAQLAGSVADVAMADPSAADPIEVLTAFALAIGGVIGFFFFAMAVHTVIARKVAHV